MTTSWTKSRIPGMDDHEQRFFSQKEPLEIIEYYLSSHTDDIAAYLKSAVNHADRKAEYIEQLRLSLNYIEYMGRVIEYLIKRAEAKQNS